jgi:hypothetical protein
MATVTHYPRSEYGDPEVEVEVEKGRLFERSLSTDDLTDADADPCQTKSSPAGSPKLPSQVV